jgi:ORF6N domain-containing protein
MGHPKSQMRKARPPADFMFKLTPKEKAEVVANCDHLRRLKFSPALPYAFTEHGAIMVASVLNSSRAIEVSVYVVRAFVKLREMVGTHKELGRKLAELQRRIQEHDEEITDLFEAIRQLMEPPEKSKKRIGFSLKGSSGCLAHDRLAQANSSSSKTHPCRRVCR